MTGLIECGALKENERISSSNPKTRRRHYEVESEYLAFVELKAELTGLAKNDLGVLKIKVGEIVAMWQNKKSKTGHFNRFSAALQLAKVPILMIPPMGHMGGIPGYNFHGLHSHHPLQHVPAPHNAFGNPFAPPPLHHNHDHTGGAMDPSMLPGLLQHQQMLSSIFAGVPGGIATGKDAGRMMMPFPSMGLGVGMNMGYLPEATRKMLMMGGNPFGPDGPGGLPPAPYNGHGSTNNNSNNNNNNNNNNKSDGAGAGCGNSVTSISSSRSGNNTSTSVNTTGSSNNKQVNMSGPPSSPMSLKDVEAMMVCHRGVENNRVNKLSSDMLARHQHSMEMNDTAAAAAAVAHHHHINSGRMSSSTSQSNSAEKVEADMEPTRGGDKEPSFSTELNNERKDGECDKAGVPKHHHPHHRLQQTQTKRTRNEYEEATSDDMSGHDVTSNDDESGPTMSSVSSETSSRDDRDDYPAAKVTKANKNSTPSCGASASSASGRSFKNPHATHSAAHCLAIGLTTCDASESKGGSSIGSRSGKKAKSASTASYASSLNSNMISEASSISTTVPLVAGSSGSSVMSLSKRRSTYVVKNPQTKLSSYNHGRSSSSATGREGLGDNAGGSQRGNQRRQSIRALRCDKVGSYKWELHEVELYDVQSFLGQPQLTSVYNVDLATLTEKELSEKTLLAQSKGLVSLDAEFRSRAGLKSVWPRNEFGQLRAYIEHRMAMMSKSRSAAHSDGSDGSSLSGDSENQSDTSEDQSCNGVMVRDDSSSGSRCNSRAASESGNSSDVVGSFSGGGYRSGSENGRSEMSAITSSTTSGDLPNKLAQTPAPANASGSTKVTGAADCSTTGSSRAVITAGRQREAVLCCAVDSKKSGGSSICLVYERIVQTGFICRASSTLNIASDSWRLVFRDDMASYITPAPTASDNDCDRSTRFVSFLCKMFPENRAFLRRLPDDSLDDVLVKYCARYPKPLKAGTSEASCNGFNGNNDGGSVLKSSKGGDDSSGTIQYLLDSGSLAKQLMAESAENSTQSHQCIGTLGSPTAEILSRMDTDAAFHDIVLVKLD